jgi:hypothetical protein
MSNDKLIDNAPDMYCHGIARIDKLGPNHRIVFTVPRVDGDGYQDVVVNPASRADDEAGLSGGRRRP